MINIETYYKYVVLIITILLLTIFRVFLNEYSKRYVEKIQTKIITQPKSYKGVALFGAISIPLIVVLCYFYSGETEVVFWSMLFVFLPLFVVTVIIYFYGLNWRVEVYSDYFVYTNIFRKSKKYLYLDVDVILKRNSYKVKRNNKTIVALSSNLENFMFLHDSIRKFKAKK